MRLYLDLLEQGKPEKRGQYLATLKRQLGHLEQLVEDILDLSRLERHKMNFEFAPVNLNQVLEEVTMAHRVRAEAASLTLRLEAEPGLPLVAGIHDQLIRVITNLVANAINYTITGEVIVSAFLAADAGQICLQVKDTGLGISEDDLPHLFDRFYRGHNVSRSNIPGTGLGLAIVKEIVELHGGRIEVESTEGQGSTFQVWLPMIP
jgi:signal transduction histidine kinase